MRLIGPPTYGTCFTPRLALLYTEAWGRCEEGNPPTAEVFDLPVGTVMIWRSWEKDEENWHIQGPTNYNKIWHGTLREALRELAYRLCLGVRGFDLNSPPEDVSRSLFNKGISDETKNR